MYNIPGACQQTECCNSQKDVQLAGYLIKWYLVHKVLSQSLLASKLCANKIPHHPSACVDDTVSTSLIFGVYILDNR